MKGASAGVLAAVALAVVPATAGAQDAVSVYSPNPEDRHFTTSAGTFTGDSDSLGVCIPALTCPTVDNHHVPTGGTMGEGFLRSEFGALAGVAGTTFASWTQGTPWQYDGAAGQRPTELTASVTRNSSLNALLDVVGNEADYVVQVIDVTDPNVPQAITLIQGSLEPTGGWTKSGEVPIQRNTLVDGHFYLFRIVSVLTYGAEVVAGGRADYDDLVLTARREDDDGGGGGGGGGGGRPGGRDAIFDGRNLFIKLRCFGEQGENGKCFTRATALKSRKGVRYTFPIQRVVKAKKGKIIRARVRFRFRKELERRNSIILKSVLRTDRDDKTKVVKFKKLRLIDRSPD